MRCSGAPARPLGNGGALCAGERRLDRPWPAGCAAADRNRRWPRPSSTSRLSSAMPSRVVWMRASMMFAAGRREARADAVEQALAVWREDADAASRRFPDRPRRSTLGLASPIRASASATWRALATCHGERLGEPVAVGQPPGMGARRARLPAERVGELLLAMLHQLGPAVLLVAEPKPLFGGLEQRPQQGPLPVVPHARADRADVDDGQDQQQPQPLRALHLVDEILDRLGVGEVALERGRRQQQMIAHQPRDGLGLGWVEAEARARASARSRRR